ncbi:MAG: hypothetical protein K2N92_02345, partial [Malacoplasma sp.]|nr:hypothetical protein [Malacoplasma sp.]
MKFDDLLKNNDSINSLIFKNYYLKTTSVFSYLNSKDFSIPKQGWKIHISSTYDNFPKVLQKTTDYFIKNNISFKYVNNEKTLKQMFSKTFSRIQSGKLITIYTLDEKNFKKIIIDLSKILKEYNSAPTVITDKQYKNSCIFYRYGSFKGKYIYFGNKKILDERKPYFFLPNFLKDPFEIKSNNQNKKEIILNERYVVKNAMSFTNFGGVYLGYDNKLEKNCVIKEYRPFFFLNNKWTSIELAKNEVSTLKIFANSKITPLFIDSFYCDKHFFIVKEYIEGINLENLSYSYSLFFLTLEDKEKIINSINFFIKVLLNFLELFVFS